jgi:hypothetical protein
MDTVFSVLGSLLERYLRFYSQTQHTNTQDEDDDDDDDDDNNNNNNNVDSSHGKDDI